MTQDGHGHDHGHGHGKEREEGQGEGQGALRKASTPARWPKKARTGPAGPEPNQGGRQIDKFMH